MNQVQNNLSDADQSEYKDFTNYFETVRTNVDQIDGYRGISKETYQKTGVGFDPEWNNQNKNRKCSPRIIIPCSNSSYEALLVETTETTDADKEYRKLAIGHRALFQEDALCNTDRPIGIVEGVFDALSIEEVGGCAIALGGVTMIDRLAEAVKQKGTCCPLYLLLDNDETGQTAQNKLATMLRKMEIPFIEAKLPSKYKDANEALTDDRKRFAAFIARVENRAIQRFSNNRHEKNMGNLEQKTCSGFEGNLMSSLISAQIQNIKDDVVEKPIATGFEKLDRALQGGLRVRQLVILGAEPGAGKTTFLLQSAAQMAKQNTTVLFFSLEMSQKEMAIKQIARLAYEHDKERNKDYRQAEKMVDALSENQKWDAIPEAVQSQLEEMEYSCDDEQENLYIIDDVFTASEIFEITKWYKENKLSSKDSLVVMIDYLQRLVNKDATNNERQTVEKNLNMIQRIYKELNVAVVCISSLNRLTYGQPIKKSSFKETGQIEYDAAVLIGLQGHGMHKLDGLSDKERVKVASEMGLGGPAKKNEDGSVSCELVIVKNRKGENAVIPLKFFGKYSYFEETLNKTCNGEARAIIRAV